MRTNPIPPAGAPSVGAAPSTSRTRPSFAPGASLLVAASLLLACLRAPAATLVFNTSAPAAGAVSISNFTGAAYDANNVGGSGTNADGGTNNGTTNDAVTYVAGNRAAQGQTFTTGANPGGYTLTDITVQAAGYTSNTATGSNTSTYSLASTASNFVVRVGRLSGTTFIPSTVEYAASGGRNNPGTGSSANGSGVYLTFTFKAPIVLKPNTTYAFDLGSSSDYFEWLGIRDAATGGNPYAGGTAYTSGASGAGGNTVATQAGDRVFMVNMTAYTQPAAGTFVHPGLLSTEADFERMRANVAAGVQPWASAYAALTASAYGNSLTWVPRPPTTIIRGGTGENFATFATDIAYAYGCALRWKVSGDTRYADEAVTILNSYPATTTGIGGDPNISLLSINSYQFACVAEIMRSYPGWAAADFANFQTWIYNTFYGLANTFLLTHQNQDYSFVWANWDLCSIDAVYAIGVLCDNQTLTNQAIEYYKNGLGEGAIGREVYYLHPGYLGQGQEAGRDQGHNTLDISLVAPFCQMTWNQGVDLFSYANNRMLAGAEYTARYNLGNDVPYVTYANNSGFPTQVTQTVISPTGRGQARNGWEIVYNHYVNVMGLAAPWSKAFADSIRPSGYYNQDQPGFDTLTASLPAISTGANPSGLTAVTTAGQPVLSWWGSAYATGYNVLRSATSGSGYTTIATGLTANTYTDTAPLNGTNYYVVVATLTGGSTTGNSNEASAFVGTTFYSQLKFDEGTGTTAADATGNGWAGTLVNGPTWVTGKTGGTDKAVKLASNSSQYVSLPAGELGTLSDFTISAWVNLASNASGARLFDFGTPNPIGSATGTLIPERYMYLVPQNGSGAAQFAITGCGPYGEQKVIGNAPLPTGQWVHVAVSLNGAVGTLYVNGVAVGANANVYFSPNRFPPTTANYIGKSQYASDPYLNGTVDDFRVYRGALSTGAIYTLATSQTPPAPPAAPTNLTLTAQAGNSIQLNWSASSGATSYTVSRATSPNGPYTVIAALVSGTTYTDTGLTAGVTYYYKVDAANNGGEGTYTSPGNAVALPPTPGAPSSLIATAASATSVGLTWTAAPNASTYNVKRALASGGPYSTVATGLTATSYTDTGLTTGTNYYYVVTATNAAGEGITSNESSAAPTSLLLQLKFDQSAATIAWDSTGHGWNATGVNAPAWAAGKFGNAIGLTGASSQYLTLPAGVVSALSEITVSVWVKMNSVGTNEHALNIGTGTGTFMTLMASTTATPAVPRFSMRLNSGTEQRVNGTAALPTGTWTHLAATLSGTTAKLYVNGTLVATNASMSITPASLGATTLNYIGKSQFSTDPTLDGAVDDLRVYTRALSATEINAIISSTPAQPQNVAATPGYRQVALSWNAVAGATSYAVRAGINAGGPYALVASGLTSPGLTLTNLAPGTTYYYLVSAVNDTGEGANSAETPAGALSTPTAPTNVTVIAGNTAALVTWTPSGSANTYNVYRSDGTGTGYVLVASGLTGTTFFDTGLNDGYNYSYVVTGTNAGGEGPVSAQGSATPVAAPVISGATSASAFYGSAFSYAITASNTPTSYAATGLPPGLVLNVGTGLISGTPTATGAYNVTLSASNAGGIGTAPLTITVQTTTPSTPTGLTAKPGSATVILSWTAASGASAYNIKRSTTSGGPYTTAGNVSGLNYTDTGLTNGTTYYYVVSAVSSIGESANSSQVSATPAAVGTDWFTQLFSSSVPNSTANTTVTFTPSTNTNKYVVSRRTGITAFPTSTTGATAIAGDDDSSTAVTLSGTAKVLLYGVGYSTFYVGSNGYITFTSDTTYSKSINNHFKRPRISALFEDLDSSTQGSMSYVQLADRVAVTWLNVPEYGAADSNNFQIEMFFDGRIRITYLTIGDKLGLIGLSGVSSTPAGFTQSTFANYPAPLAAPGGLTAVGTNGAVALRWSDAPGATSYNVKRSATSGSGYVTVASGLTTASYTDTGLTNGTAYYYVVSAVNALVGEGIDSAEAAVTPQSAPPAPTSLTTIPGGSLVGLTWTAASGATRYTVRRSTVSGSGYTTLATLSGNGFIDGTAASGATYYYIVTSSNDAGTSANSAEATITLAPSAPTGLAATGGNAAITLAWTAPNGAASYTVYRASGGGAYAALAGGTTTATGFTDTAVTNGTAYSYVVTATNAGGTSAVSNAASATPLQPITAAETAAPTLTMTGTGSGASITATIGASVSGHRYQLQYTDDLVAGTWTNVGAAQTGTGGSLTFSAPVDTTAVPRRFYRIFVQQM